MSGKYFININKAGTVTINTQVKKDKGTQAQTTKIY